MVIRVPYYTDSTLQGNLDLICGLGQDYPTEWLLRGRGGEWGVTCRLGCTDVLGGSRGLHRSVYRYSVKHKSVLSYCIQINFRVVN